MQWKKIGNIAFSEDSRTININTYFLSEPNYSIMNGFDGAWLGSAAVSNKLSMHSGELGHWLTI